MIRYGLQWQALQDYLAIEETSNSSVWGENAGGTPPDNHVFIYAKDKSGVSGLYWKNDAGTEFDLSISNPVSGTGVSGRVAFWDSTSSITSDADLTFSVDTLTVTKIIASTSITISTLTAGSVVFAGTAGILSQNNANFFWDDSNKRLGIGVTPAFPLHLQTADASSFNLTIDAYGTGVSANYRGRVARGTASLPSQLTTDDNCTLLSALPYNNSPGFAGGARAQIQMNAAEAQTSSAQGMYINFKTTPTGSTTIAERFRIGPAGQWGIGGATYGSSGAYFRSGGASAAPVWSTLILPNAATANYIAYATSSNNWGESSNLQFDGTDFILGSGIRARMSGQNRFRYLNPLVRVYKSGNQTIATATATAVTFDSELLDTDTIHDNATNNSRLTAKLAGKYYVWGICQFAIDSTGHICGFYIYKNGALESLGNFMPQAVVGTIGDICTGGAIVSLAVNDYVEMFAYQESGGNLVVAGGNSYNTQFGMDYIGE